MANNGIFEEGKKLLNEGKFEESVEKFEEVLKNEPNNVSARIFLSKAYCELKDNDGAIRLLTEGLQNEPKNPDLLFEIGKIYLENINDTKNASIFFKKIIDIDDKFIPAYIMLGKSHRIEGKYDKALEYLDKAISINNNADEAYFNKSIILHKLNNNNEAFNNIKKAIEINESVGLYYYVLAHFYLDESDFDTALDYYKKSIKLDKSLISHCIDKSAHLLRAGLVDEGEKLLNIVLDEDPTNTKALLLLSEMNQGTQMMY